MDFEKKVVIVTGGAQGIGMAVSTAFAEEGASVVIVDIDEEAGEEHLLSLRRINPAALFIQADVAQETDVQRLVETVLHKFSGIDILVNNAGIMDRQSLFERSMEQWDRIVDTNLRAPYMMAKYCGQALMASGKGVIINLASTRALMSEKGTEPYSASKGGIVALTHSLAVSLGPKVRVNAISPGWIEVSDWKKASARVTPVHSAVHRDEHPAGRVGIPQDISRACLFLADERAGFITGANLVIDGGMTIKMIYESE